MHWKFLNKSSHKIEGNLLISGKTTKKDDGSKRVRKAKERIKKFHKGKAYVKHACIQAGKQPNSQEAGQESRRANRHEYLSSWFACYVCTDVCISNKLWVIILIYGSHSVLVSIYIYIPVYNITRIGIFVRTFPYIYICMHNWCVIINARLINH